MDTPKIIDRITSIRDLFADGEIGSEEMIEHLDDLLIDIKDTNDGFTSLNDDDSYYKSFEETDFTKLDT